MKLGQLLSLQSGDLPEEGLLELANLQMRAYRTSARLALVQFKSALGKYPEEMFRKFDPEPFAAEFSGQGPHSRRKGRDDNSTGAYGVFITVSANSNSKSAAGAKPKRVPYGKTVRRATAGSMPCSSGRIEQPLF